MAYNVAPLERLVEQFERLPGIGKKTAQRIIVELKDKMKNEDAVSSNDAPVIRSVVSSDSEEAIAALQVLAYPNKDAVHMVNAVANEGMSVEEIVKQALKNSDTSDLFHTSEMDNISSSLDSTKFF